MTEDNIQKNVLAWAFYQRYKDKRLAEYIHHSPNGGFRNEREGAKFKAMGVKAGYPDLIIDIAKGGYHGLRIELKTEKGKLLKHQKTRIALLESENYKCCVCYGLDSAINEIKRYLEL